MWVSVCSRGVSGLHNNAHWNAPVCHMYRVAVGEYDTYEEDGDGEEKKGGGRKSITSEDESAGL